jgi:hypothetical protein
MFRFCDLLTSFSEMQYIEASFETQEPVQMCVTTGLSKEGSTLRKKWADEIQRYESDEATKEGKREILERARLAEEERDLFSKKYRLMEIAAGLLQVAIVLASASIITGVIALLWASGGLGIISLGFIASGIFFPTVL